MAITTTRMVNTMPATLTTLFAGTPGRHIIGELPIQQFDGPFIQDPMQPAGPTLVHQQDRGLQTNADWQTDQLDRQRDKVKTKPLSVA